MKPIDTTTLGGRIRLVRQSIKPKKLSIGQFGESLGGISESAMTSYELNNVTPSVAVLELICSKYNINRYWLETGDGPMTLPPDEAEDLVDEAMANGDPIIKQWLVTVVKDPEMLAEFTRRVLDLADFLRDNGFDNKKPEE